MLPPMPLGEGPTSMKPVYMVVGRSPGTPGSAVVAFDDEACSSGDEAEADALVATHAAMWPFGATGPDQLSVRKGERVVVVERFSDGWTKVRLAETSPGGEGLVPDSYLCSV